MASRKKIVTVTGATGFVGRALVQRLLNERDVMIRCLVRPGSDVSVLRRLGGDVNLVFGDITQPETLLEAFDGAWGVVNLAVETTFLSSLSHPHIIKLRALGAEEMLSPNYFIVTDRLTTL